VEKGKSEDAGINTGTKGRKRSGTIDVRRLTAPDECGGNGQLRRASQGWKGESGGSQSRPMKMTGDVDKLLCLR
jgi:hypothetical protein